MTPRTGLGTFALAGPVAVRGRRWRTHRFVATLRATPMPRLIAPTGA
ncbi:MAG: hypothetical protein ACLQHS_00655 [Candidatus Limnocylindrales bacterium]